MVSIKTGVVAVSAYLMLLLVIKSPYKTSGYLVISPFPRAAVCQDGDTLEVTCTTSDHFLTWKLTKRGTTYRITRTLSSTIRNPETVVVNSTVFTFLRTSELERTPLTSTLKIGSVSQNLNGTKIVCMEVGASAMMTSTTVYIIKHVYHPTSPEIVVTKENFGVDEVTISLGWLPTQELVENLFESLVSYYVSIKPSVGVEVDMVDATRANLTLTYNTLYHVSVTAIFCDQVSTSTNINLTYANCGNPLDHNRFNYSNVQAIGNSLPALEGDDVTLSCPFELQINGSNVSICMENGKWEPDPGEVTCIEREVVYIVDVAHTGSDGLMNLSHTATDFDISMPRKSHHSMKMMIGITVLGALIVVGFIVVTTVIIAVAVVKRIKLKDNDIEPLVSNIHLECVHFNQELYEKKDVSHSNATIII